MGYSGGSSEWPTYKSIKDHTEAVRVVYDRSKLTYEDILELFFEQQGGPPTYPGYSRQYRSALLVHSEDQKTRAEEMIKNLSKGKGGKKIFTDIEDAQFTEFYRAEEYHQKYSAKQNSRRSTW